MKMATLKRSGRQVAETLARGLVWISLISAASLSAATVDTIGGGPITSGGKPYGYRNGSTLLESQFNGPAGIALDAGNTNLYVADLTNNAVRRVDFTTGLTTTFASNGISRPVAVAVDGARNVYVLNRGTGSNGRILRFDRFGILRATNAPSLVNATAMVMDDATNLYVTVSGNTVIRVTPTNVVTTIATIPNAGTALQGITITSGGLLAITDSGNHGIWLVNPNVVGGNPTPLTGFNGPGDQLGPPDFAQFNRPWGIAGANQNILIVADRGNHRVKMVTIDGIVEHFYGIPQSLWFPNQQFPGWFDGEACDNGFGTCAEAREPYAVTIANNGDVYTSEFKYHILRKVTGTGLPEDPPPPPQVQKPQIGYVTFPFPEFLSQLNVESSSFVFNNEVIIAIRGEPGSEVRYTIGPKPAIGSIPDPSPNSGITPPPYQNNWTLNQVGAGILNTFPDTLIKAIGIKNDGSPNSQVVEARFQFITGTPVINGKNAASFTVSNITVGAAMYYTTDGSDPDTNSPITKLVVNPVQITDIPTNFTFKVQAFRDGFQPSSITSFDFSASNFIPTRITFGANNVSEPRSAFVARPGQIFYAPVTLQLKPEGEQMYSLQFNVGVTNGAGSPAVQPGAGIDFFSSLISSVPREEGDHNPPFSDWFLTIRPFLMSSTTVSNGIGQSIFVNTNNNLLGVGWLYRSGFEYTVTDSNFVVLTHFDTRNHDLISFSSAHDTLFVKENGVVVVGAYSFEVPSNAAMGDQYFLQLGSPSATRDGIGAPGSDVLILPPVAPQAVTVGTPMYLVGDAAPFGWFNAGDFGNSNLNNADVMQVYQSGVLGVNAPPRNSDLFRAMDSSGRLRGVDLGNQVFAEGPLADPDVIANLFDGSNAGSINAMTFGDGELAIDDVYVTFRRSLDPSVDWVKRFWSTEFNQFVAINVPSQAFNSNSPAALPFVDSYPQQKSGSTVSPSLVFSAGDAIAGAGQLIQIPVKAKVLGNHPLRVAGLSVTVTPLDGSPKITSQVQFSPAAGLGAPTITMPKHSGNYNAAWLNNSIGGLSGDATMGTLTIRIPTNATASSAYAVRFEHASGSPNGHLLFPKQTLKGLVTTTDRSSSTYNDGIPDSWRLKWFSTVNNLLSQASADADGDGASNLHEYKAGTNPNDVKSILKVNSEKEYSGECVVRWPSALNKQYVIEKSYALYGGSWTSVSTNSGTGWEMEYRDPHATGNCFYRVRVNE
jgi:hypothetical protein